MKLRNKETGELGTLNYYDGKTLVVYPIDENYNAIGDKKYVYNSLAEFNKHWKDYEEPREGFKGFMKLNKGFVVGFYDEETSIKELEKAKAWQRLRDKGARFKEWFWDKNYGTCIIIGDSESSYIDDGDDQNKADLDLLFGGEE